MDAKPHRPAQVTLDLSDEKGLIAGLRNGDAASYEHIVEAYGGRMLAVARRLVRIEEDARDCVQDAFLQVFRNIHTFEERSSLGSWLHRIVVNAALMKIRGYERRQESSLDDLMPQFDADGWRTRPSADPLVPFETLLESREIRQLVRRCIDQLPVGYRTVLILRDIEEYDTGETAVLLELTPGAVKTRLHRARTALKQLLESVLRDQEP
jgi:RNA polymerase sigma-70 factor (ECF subfamily)